MRIALIHTRYGSGGGVEAYLRHLVEHLAETGCEIHFFGRRAEADRQHLFTFHKVRCLPVPQALRIASFAYRSARMVRADSFDLTMGFGRTFGHDFHRDSNGAFEPFRRAVAGSFSRSAFYCAVVRHLERKLYTDPDLLHTICVSNFVRDQILARYPVKHDRISVLYNGVDTKVFSPEERAQRRRRLRESLGVSAEKPVALFVANDWRRKGLETVLRALTLCPQWELWVLGEDRRAGSFQKVVRTLHLQDRVRFLGVRPSAPFYGAADIFVFPSLFDPLANVVLEALASGSPVVVSPTDGACELVSQGENGYVLPSPGDWRALAAYMQRLLDPTLREKLGARAARSVSYLTWQHHFDRLDRLLREAARKKQASDLEPGSD